VSTADAVTTSDLVRRTYYGQPVIKKPHWKWLVINYFFVAGLAGGGALISTIADFVCADRSLSRLGRYLSIAAITPAPILLTFDLGRPNRSLHMFRILKLKSPMSLGSWALLLLGGFSTLLAGLEGLSHLLGREVLPGPRRVIGLVSLPFAVFVSGYTGVLLAATNVPLWARNYLLLGPTFVASSFSSTLSVLTLLLGLGSGERPDTAQRVAQAEAVVLGAELGLLIGGVVRLGRLSRPLTTGWYGFLFWPIVVVAGTIVPLISLLTGPVQGKTTSRSRRTATALLAITGSYTLRMLMILAGRKSADRPEDYFEYTRRR